MRRVTVRPAREEQVVEIVITNSQEDTRDARDADNNNVVDDVEAAMPRDSHDIGLKACCTEGSEDDVDYSTTPLYCAMTWLIVTLKVFGLHYVRRPPGKEGQTSKGSSASTISEVQAKILSNISPLQVYCFCIWAYAWLYTVFRIITQSRNTLAIWLSDMFWMANVCMDFSCVLAAAHRRNALRKYFMGCMRLGQTSGVLTNIHKFRRTMKIVVVCLWCSLVAGLFLTNYVMFGTGVVSFVLPSSGVSPGQQLTLQLLYFFFLFFGQITCALVGFLELCMSAIIHFEFRHLANDIRKKMSDKEKNKSHGHGTTPPAHSTLIVSLEPERLRFHQISHIVKALDNAMSLRHVSTIVCNMAALCLLVYGLLFPQASNEQEQSSAQLGAFGVWTIVSLTELVVVCISGALVSSGITKVKDRLLRINCHDTTLEPNFNVQITLFLGKLSDREGLTVCRMFTIDQTAFMSLAGMFVTYFLIVVQFAPTAIPKSDNGVSNTTLNLSTVSL